MAPCVKCGGKEFKIDAVVAATDTIELGEDPNFDDFEVIDTDHFDSEWQDDSQVRCTNCQHTFTYKDWDSQGKPVDPNVCNCGAGGELGEHHAVTCPDHCPF